MDGALAHHFRGCSLGLISTNSLNTIRAGINDQVHDVGSNCVYIILFLIYQELENLRIYSSELMKVYNE